LVMGNYFGYKKHSFIPSLYTNINSFLLVSYEVYI
jgi:hypothetical protein